jgi:prophage DNA circulation protein
MATILDIPNTPWRDELLPASFRGAEFHVETNSVEGGRRIVTHQFPKKELPYSEDLGRQAVSWSVRGYCIVFPFNTGNTLYSRDYRIARDNLRIELDRGGPGILQMPTIPAMTVVCSHYRLTEEVRFGGYCTFDMSFNEYGDQPIQYKVNPRSTLIGTATVMQQRMQALLDQTAPDSVQVQTRLTQQAQQQTTS